jgi:alpha-1,3-rhamnosyltransferase
MTVNHKTPIVSIIVITYNSSRYILETLESARKQSYQNIELIISDDCSTDNTIQLCKDWLKINQNRFVNSKLIEAEINTGIPGNCNRGWKAGQGEWIKLIAGDDVLLENCIQSNLTFISQNPDIKLLYSEANKIDENSNPLPDDQDFYKGEIKGWRNSFFSKDCGQQLKMFVRHPGFLISPTIFVNTGLLKNIDGFDENLRVFEDIPFVIRVLGTGVKICHFPVRTVNYRLHSQSISKNTNKEKSRLILGEFAKIYSLYRKPHLSWFNPIDAGIRFEAWLDYTYAHKWHLKGAGYLKLLNIFRIFNCL